MPNHVENILKISGNKTELEKIRKEANDKKEIFSINKLIPMPEEVTKIASPTEILSNKEYIKEYAKYQERIKKNPEFSTGLPLTNKKSEELIRKFGSDNWYDWAISNWGTKWGSYNSELLKIGKSYIKYIFDSAWSPPIEGLEKISRKYPNLKFRLKYTEEGCGFSGIAKFQNGLIEDIDTTK